MRHSSVLTAIVAFTAAAPLAFVPATSRAVPSGSGADNARVIGTLSVQGLSANAFPVRSYAWAAQTPMDASGGGATGRTQWTDITVTRLVDAVSPQILLGIARGSRYTNATLTIYRAGSTSEVLARYSFTDLQITSHAASDLGRSNGAPIESVSFTWRRITVQVGNTQVCYDRSTSTSC
jgi:type VI secretion system Hcp family effector